jgi:uncharacterized protein (TIGR02118 family)
MHKLVILIESPGNPAALEDAWPRFLHLAENMPGLRRETTSRVVTTLYGKADYILVHELYFDSLSAAQAAMASREGGEAGRLLQSITAGRVVLFLADHKEDELANILSYRSGSDKNAPHADLD